MKQPLLEWYNKYIGNSIELNSVQVSIRVGVVLVALMLFLRFSGINSFNHQKQNALNTSITAIVVFYAAFSVFSVDGFVSCLVAMFVFGVLLRATRLLTQSNEQAFEEEQVSN